jgi:hypothetical protein
LEIQGFVAIFGDMVRSPWRFTHAASQERALPNFSVAKQETIIPSP